MRAVWLAAIAIGCGHPSTPPTTPAGPPAQATVADAPTATPVQLEDDLPKLAERAVKMYQDWQKAFADAGTDCAAATTKMNALADANADLIAANARLTKSGHEKIKAARAELEKHSAEIDPAAQAIMQGPTMGACSSDPAFGKALDRLAGEG
ncbi:MAG TPA: hypothetical protein VL326_36460 [Kofleriaceae bacterium]|jgi:hypothetical protein|nr:hypothetical protein [Kofleriaceae bacterium]